MVFTHEGIPFHLVVGRELTVANELKQNLKTSYQQQTDCILIPLFHPSFTRDKTSIEEEIDPLAKADTLIDSDKWLRNVLGKLSQNIDLDSKYSHISSKSKFYLKQELNYAIHLGVNAFIIPSPMGRFENYARLMNKVNFSVK